jgi:hypothetical protein
MYLHSIPKENVSNNSPVAINNFLKKTNFVKYIGISNINHTCTFNYAYIPVIPSTSK